MREVDQDAEPVAFLYDIHAKRRHALVLGPFGLEIAKRIADVVHQLQMAQPLAVGFGEQFQTVGSESRAFERDHHVRDAGARCIDVAGRLHMPDLVFRQVGAHPVQALPEIHGLLPARRGPALLYAPSAST